MKEVILLKAKEMSLYEAYKFSLENNIPTAIKANYYQDDRGFSCHDLFPDVLRKEGQINFMTIAPRAVKAWHLHENQTDIWFVSSGTLKIGIISEEFEKFYVSFLGERNPELVIIPPFYWHGCINNKNEEANVIYYMDRQYNHSKPDEIKLPADYLNHEVELWKFGDIKSENFWDIWNG